MEPVTSKAKKEVKKSYGIYMLHVLERSISLPFNSVGSNIKQVLEEKLMDDLEGKCSNEGYIKENSIRVLTYSSGMLHENNVQFHVIFECLVCNPVEGVRFPAVVKNITKAGIRAEYKTKDGSEESPVIVFISRDHHYTNKDFGKVEIGNSIHVQVIGSRFELYDTQIAIVGELVASKKKSIKKKPKLKLKLKPAAEDKKSDSAQV